MHTVFISTITRLKIKMHNAVINTSTRYHIMAYLVTFDSHVRSPVLSQMSHSTVPTRCNIMLLLVDVSRTDSPSRDAIYSVTK